MSFDNQSPAEASSSVSDLPPSPTADESAASGTDRPRVWTVFTTIFLGLVLALFFQAALGAILAAVEMARGTGPGELQQAILDRLANPYVFLLLVATGQLAFFIAALVAAMSSSEPLRTRIGWLVPRPSRIVYPVAMLSSLLPLAIGLASARLVAKVVTPDATFDKLFESMTAGASIVFVVFIGIVPGLVEEILFRGYAQTRLVKRWGAVAGIGITSTLFALVHGTPHAIAAAAPLGFWFGYIAWRSGSILPTILCHFFVNSGLNAWRMVIKFGEPAASLQTAVNIGTVAIGILCFAICCTPAFWRGVANHGGHEATSPGGFARVRLGIRD